MRNLGHSLSGTIALRFFFAAGLACLFLEAPAFAADPVKVLFVKNGYYQQETDILNHLTALGCYQVTTMKDYQVKGTTVLSGYDLIIITEFAPGISSYGINNIKNSGKPVLIVEYWDFWYSYKLGLVDDDWAGYFGTKTVNLFDTQNPIAFILGDDIDVYSSNYTVYGAPESSIKSGVTPLVYSSISFDEIAVYFDKDRKIAATGIYDTTRYSEDGWRLFDTLLNMLLPTSSEEVHPPDGFTQQEWLQFLMDKMWSAKVANYGGINLLLVGLEEPLSYTGEHPVIEKIWLTEEEMIALGVQPGDEAEGSTPMHKKIYLLDIDTNDTGGNLMSGDGDCANPYDPRCSSWSESIDGFHIPANGSGLLIGTESYLMVEGCQSGQWTEPHGFEARFSNDGQKGVTHFTEADFRLNMPATDCTVGTEKKYTYYARNFPAPWSSSGQIWLVASAYKWLFLGEDSWDRIYLSIWHTEVGGGYIVMDKVKAVHNDYAITLDEPLADPNYIGGRTYFRDLSPELLKFKQSLIAADDNWLWGGFTPVPVAVREAIKDYGQGPHKKYPIFPKDAPEQAPPPYTGTINIANPWCSEFASWALRQEDPSLENPSDPDAPIIPIANIANPDIGVRAFYNWLNNPSWLLVPEQERVEMRFFGNDTGNPNGPTDQEWSNLGTEIFPGDYIARNQRDDSDSQWLRHSMIFIGWVDQENWTSLGPVNFVTDRKWNFFLEVSGNVDGSGIPGSRVGSRVRVICRPDWIYVPNIGLTPMDPIDLPGNLDCYIRLWDPHIQNGEWEGGFFGLLH